MIGTGWLVLMDDWLGRGGPLGAILGFVLGGIILLPVGYVYGQWVLRLPDAAGEAAYTAQVFPPIVSYFTGWIMLLAYFIVCPWEAIALGKIAAYIFPQTRFHRGLSCCGPAGFPAPPGSGHRAHHFPDHHQLPRHPPERQFPEGHDDASSC